jgi:hypothetical protein
MFPALNEDVLTQVIVRVLEKLRPSTPVFSQVG